MILFLHKRNLKSTMHIEKSHNLGQQEAMRRVDNFLDTLVHRPLPAGLSIENPSKVWSGNVMNFSFRVKKGWLGTSLAGTLSITEQSVVLDSVLPGMIRAFVSENDIRALLEQQLDHLLGQK